jgi:hypothetical protein
MISRRTKDLFRLWNDGVPQHGIVNLGADWASRYTKVGVAARIIYFSDKWSAKVQSPQDDISATYEHIFEGAPAHVWVPDPDGRSLSLPSDVACLGSAMELELDDGQVERWRKGTAHLVAMSRSSIAIIPKGSRTVPVIITNTRVTPDGIDDF